MTDLRHPERDEELLEVEAGKTEVLAVIKNARLAQSLTNHLFQRH
jgi:hypothetical protein